MIFISGVISTIFQTNMLCTNKTRVIYFYLNCVNFFARKRSFLLFFSGQLPPCHHPPNSWAYVHSPLYERKLKKNINIVFFSKIFSPSAWAFILVWFCRNAGRYYKHWIASWKPKSNPWNYFADDSYILRSFFNRKQYILVICLLVSFLHWFFRHRIFCLTCQVTFG